MRTTIKDIARATGLSITAVSLVLNNKGKNISLKHRQLVEETAKRLNYRPNQLAVGLIKKRTHTIGLILPDISNVFFSELTKGIEDAGREWGYNIILCNSNDQHALEMKYINILADRGVDGIVVAMSAQSFDKNASQSFDLIKEYHLPAVIVDCFVEVDEFNTVTVDNFTGSRLAVEYLIERGHRRIACIAGPQGPKTNRDRLLGYTATLVEHGIAYDENLVYEGDFRYQSGYEAVELLLPYSPTAIFCHNDLMAYGVLKSLRERSMSIPEDISLVGFDDIFFSEIMDVPLTTVRQPVYEMGVESMKILAEDIKDAAGERRQMLFKPELIVRDSVRQMLLQT